MSLGDDFIEKLAELVATRVATKLGTMPGVTYTTAKTGPFVPGKSRAWMLKNVKIMPGARKAGATWMISKEDFEAWARAADARAVRPVSGSVDELADAFLDRAGYRATKGAVPASRRAMFRLAAAADVDPRTAASALRDGLGAVRGRPASRLAEVAPALGLSFPEPKS